MNKSWKDAACCLVSLMFGVLAFKIFSDPQILNPSNIAWLMAGDPSQHYLGWNTFRSTPLIQWPLGLNYNYGMAVSNSIVYTDSIPLLAIPFKYISFMLPADFQYTGMWLFACYLLQSFFGFKLFDCLTANKIFSLVGGFILSFAPTFVMRMQGHYALCAQFLILIAFILYLKPFSKYKWTLLLCVTSLVHAYLLMMIFAVFFCKIIVDTLISKEYKIQIKNVCIAVAATLLTMYVEGYFVISHGLAAGGFGEFRADLFSLFNPFTPAFSKFSRVNNNQLVNGEGLAYVGFGIIMCLGSLVMMVSNKISKKEMVLSSGAVFVPIIFLTLIYFFAVSNVISLQGYEIFRINLPHFLVGPANTFRASGRFMWVISYFVMIAAIFSVFYFSKKTCSYIIILIALAQLFDTYKFGELVRANVAVTAESWSHNNVDDYTVDYSKFKSVAMYSPKDFEDKSKVIYLAALHKLPVNAGYMARYDVVKDAEQTSMIEQQIASNKLDDDVIYFIGHSAKGLEAFCNNGFTCQDGFAGKMMFKNK
ncbi:DUF6311 domain-containing protein [Lonsdalea quercina]|uniref:DUF6311 domain-containing protein n=1 Tax=Lonsdalea quercina TaxID=71657 RepID=UPI0039750B9A